jgi:CheY-like chemotaxis protein
MSRRRILIVEDEIVSAMFIRSVVEQIGYGVTAIVATGEEAIEAALSERPDLILVDVRLTGTINGIVAARRIKDLTGIGSIIVSAYGLAELRKDYDLDDEFLYLRKPVVEDQLEAALRAVFEDDTEPTG